MPRERILCLTERCNALLQSDILEQKQGIKMLLALSHAVRSTHHDLVLEALACLTAQWPSLMRAAFAEDASIKRKIEEQLKSPLAGGSLRGLPLSGQLLPGPHL